MIPFSKLLAVLNHPFDEVARNEAYAARLRRILIYPTGHSAEPMVDAQIYGFVCALRTFTSTYSMKTFFYSFEKN